ncbi:MAG: acylase [Pseudomonas sp.]|uniref:bifunctional acylase PvdQ n=1 Tax=Pseudomonas sp. TaxID=306 RepID=UPI003D120722
MASPVAMAQEPLAEINWTSFGVPHIRASDEYGLGYGVGYAYARDNLCLLADEVLTVRGERARFLGREGKSFSGLDNVRSDFFFRWLNDDARITHYLTSQPQEARQLLSGYVAGYNRYLATDGSESCRGKAWLQPLQEADMVRLVQRLQVGAGIGRFADAMLAAVPPGNSEQPPVTTPPLETKSDKDFAQEQGSNAIAVGGQRTENGKGRLLANPHFPWVGALRFYQMHLTIPGKMDVMGASLAGMPVVNIGFNQHLAWTHTVDSSSHFTLHRLTLSPDNPLHYLVDGQSQALTKTTLSIDVREADGRLSQQSRDIYLSRLGPVVVRPGVLPWDSQHAYALQDANLGNTRALQQWLSMNQARDLQTFQKSIQDLQGIPWVNTLAVDDQGLALYMNASVIPNVSPQQLQTCALPQLIAKGLPGLDGSRAACDWQRDASAAQPGIVPGRYLPHLQRRDFVQNANDSAWLSHPDAPLTGFSPLISREGRPLSPRTRYALDQLRQHGEQPLSEAFLQRLVTDNRVYLADLLLNDVLAFCASRPLPDSAGESCTALAAWDRHAALDSSLGMLYFQHLIAAFTQLDTSWRVPFDANDPLHTPHGLAWQKEAVATHLEQALSKAADKVKASGVAADTRWGQVQGTRQGDTWIPVPGGDGRLGIYNAIQSQPRAEGRQEVVGGTSYLQLVSFTKDGPVAKGLLAHSQSSDPSSPHYRDQTVMFSRQEWPTLPFTLEQIEADPNLQTLRIWAQE